MTSLRDNKYSKAIDQIVAPVELKEKTQRLLAVHASRRKTMRIVGSVGTIAAVLLMVIGLTVWFGIWETPQGSDATVEDYGEGVLPQEELLHFIDLSTDDFSLPARFSPAYPLRRNFPLDEVTGALPSQIPPGLKSPDGSITAYFSAPTEAPEALVGRAVYLADDGGSLTVTFANNSSFLYIPFKIGGSEINGVSLGLGALIEDEIYYAAFRKNGFTFLVASEGITQEEFVDLLSYFVTE